MNQYKKILKVIPLAGVLSTSLLIAPNNSLAATNLDMCLKQGKGYEQTCVEQNDSSDPSRIHAMYETINHLVEIDDLNEQTNWKKDSYNFIRLNYLILPSQEQGVLDRLNTIPKDNVQLQEVLKALNGYHNGTNTITGIDTLQISNPNVDKYVEAPKPDPNSDQYENIISSASNQNYTNKIIGKTQNITKTLTSSKQLTVTHSMNIGMKESMHLTLGTNFLGLLDAKNEITFEFSANYGYTNASTSVDTVSHVVNVPSEEFEIAPRTAVVKTAKLSTPVYTSKLLGTSKIKGYYTDQVNTYPTWVQLGIYNKFKVISQHNPTIWNKLKELGFDLDDQTKEVIFKGVIDMKDKKEPGSVYESKVQTYELDANGDINFNKPVGSPVVKPAKLAIQ
ncbi:ETX/MTX2 family pore-forming toxin (plasmid) [Bacillus cereus]|uniref:ETX/MTX2 family pore-forming toxin n=1 Tax=Bacillus cereus TaxID=1396 RepID=UPI001F33354E|nr:ETX/MTX2 family pore-forming toxin [Bacillus cereus]UIJ69769.1 ETX/MTX2 family pore-forming toxin [Bacillus cereus]